MQSIDFYRPLPASKDGLKYILSTIDAFSKYVVLYPLRRANTKSVINKLGEDHFSKYGKSFKIITNHGTEFSLLFGLVFTDIFVRDLREHRTSLRLLPLTQSPGSSSFVRGLTGWVSHVHFFFAFFCIIY